VTCSSQLTEIFGGRGPPGVSVLFQILTRHI